MTDRKFTPPTEFPAEYITSGCRKAVILGRMPNDYFQYVGYVIEKDRAREQCWSDEGLWNAPHEGGYDLHDLPKKQVRWANDYASSSSNMWYASRYRADLLADSHRIAVIRREWVEGQPPQYFTEEV